MIRNRGIIIIGAGLLLDQSIKYFFYTYPARVVFFGYYLNQNFSWSLPVNNLAVIILTAILLLSLIYWRQRLFGPRWAWYLIGLGALSNLVDRLWRGGVVDYIFLPYGGVINLADIFIIAGVIWILCWRK